MNICWKVVGIAALAASFSAAQAQISIIPTPPQVIQADQTETFESFAKGYTTSTLSIWGGNGSVSFDLADNFGTSYQTQGYIYTGGASSSNPIYPGGVAAQSFGSQGLGLVDQFGVSGPVQATVSLKSGIVGYGFGGYFQADSDVSFEFFNGKNLIGIETLSSMPSGVSFLSVSNATSTGTLIDFTVDPVGDNGNLQLISFGFDPGTGLNPGTGFTSVEISAFSTSSRINDGTIAMDNLFYSQSNIVTTTPEPATFAPLGLGLLFLARRKRK